MNALGVSPQRSSGTAITETSSTPGCSMMTFSTSWLEMFSPPEMMTSFARSFSSIWPSGCQTPRSPEWNQPPENAFAVASGSSR